MKETVYFPSKILIKIQKIDRSKLYYIVYYKTVYITKLDF